MYQLHLIKSTADCLTRRRQLALLLQVHCLGFIGVILTLACIIHLEDTCIEHV